MPFVAIYGKKYFVFYPLTGMEVEDKELFTYEEEVISGNLTGARSTLKYSPLSSIARFIRNFLAGISS